MRNDAFQRAADAAGFAFDDPVAVGGRYTPLLRDGGTVWISGQVPRMGSALAVTGRVGERVDLAHEVPLGRAAHGRVAGHHGNVVHIEGREQRARSQAGGGQRRLAARVAGADDDDIITSGRIHGYQLQ